LLLANPGAVDSTELWGLKKNAIIGTSSARRKSQLLALRPDLQIKDLRGNVPTRIKKLKTEGYDAILLAKAGVNRLNLDLSDLHVEVIDPTVFVPAPAQGVLGLQIRTEDSRLAEILSNLNHTYTAQKIELERNVLRLMEGGCQLPLGVYCDGKTVHVAHAKTSNEASNYSTFEYNNQDQLAQSIVDSLSK
jgi:hydroxymethylbilane synthase